MTKLAKIAAQRMFEKQAISTGALNRAFVKRLQDMKAQYRHASDEVFDNTWDRTIEQVRRMKDDTPRNDPKYKALEKMKKKLFPHDKKGLMEYVKRR